MEWLHGGDWKSFEEEYGRTPLDFSANISPLGMPEGVRWAAAEALKEADRYPDPDCRALRRALATHLRVPAEWILCGNGAADLIWRLGALEPKRALLSVPSFLEYERALLRAGCSLDHYCLREERGFRMERDFPERITRETDLVILCEPNNPTGVTTDPALLRGILERCRRVGALLVVDECFLEFLDAPEEHTLLPLLAEYRENLLLLRAFTKYYGMAGLRLGYLICGDPGLCEVLKAVGPPWAVSGTAQAAGMAALREKKYTEKLRRLVREQRERLFRELEACGLRVIPGEANFLLFRAEDALLSEKLKERGILIRDCGNFRGLAPGWVRAAVRTREENRRLVEALRDILQKG